MIFVKQKHEYLELFIDINYLMHNRYYMYKSKLQVN